MSVAAPPVPPWGPHWLVLGWVVLMSLLALFAFGRDKHAARTGAWRTSEGSLLMLAFFGGALGAKAGQRLYRHKTRKQPFKSILNVMLVINLVVLGVMSSPGARGAVGEVASRLVAAIQRSGEAERERTAVVRRF